MKSKKMYLILLGCLFILELIGFWYFGGGDRVAGFSDYISLVLIWVVFGGIGLLIYIAAWIVAPKQKKEKIVLIISGILLLLGYLLLKIIIFGMLAF